MSRSSEWMRLLDRLVGIPAVYLLGARRRRRPLPERPSKIGLIMPTAIGDTILGSGVVWALSRRYPSAELVVFHGATNAGVVRLIPLKLTTVTCRFTNPVATIRSIRRQNLDLIVDLTPWTRLTAIYAIFGARVTVGFDPPTQQRGAAFDIPVFHRSDSHEFENHARLASLFGDADYRTRIATDPSQKLVGLKTKSLILCHVTAGGSRAEDKKWPAENWALLARRLVTAGWRVGFTGVAMDAPEVEAILNAAGLPSADAFSLCGKASLAELADLLRRVSLLITIDTGVLHLASAVGANILALHGPTRSSRWGALNEQATSLNSSHPAAGYIIFGYETHPDGSQTMLTHTVDDVAKAAFAKLEPARQPVD